MVDCDDQIEKNLLKIDVFVGFGQNSMKIVFFVLFVMKMGKIGSNLVNCLYRTNRAQSYVCSALL